MNPNLLILSILLFVSSVVATSFEMNFTNSVTENAGVLMGDGVAFWTEDASVTGMTVITLGVDNDNNQTTNVTYIANRRGKYTLVYDGNTSEVDHETVITNVGTSIAYTNHFAIGNVLDNDMNPRTGIRVRCDTYNTNGVAESYDSIKLTIITIP